MPIIATAKRKIARPMETTLPAKDQASASPSFKVLVKTGIKADEKVPNTKTWNIASGSLKAAKKRERDSGSK